MISIEKAVELKSLGLEWEPKEGDWFATSGDDMANIFVVSGEHDLVPELGGRMWFFNGHSCSRDGGCRANETASDIMNMDGFKPDYLKVFMVTSAKEMLWLPSLDQLLAEVARRNVSYILKWSGGKHEFKISDGVLFVGDFEAGTPEDAAADALIWILKQEKK